MTDEEVSHMSISALKSVLYQNHVNARLLLEKSDLVARVHALLGDERHERAREAAIHAREEEEIIARQHAMMEEERLREEQARQEREWAHMGSAHVPGDDGQQPMPKVSPPPMMGTAADLERNGLCVVCQDEEANIAIVDCGYVFTSAYLSARVTDVSWQPFGNVPTLLRSHHVLIARVSTMSYPHRHGSSSSPYLQVIMLYCSALHPPMALSFLYPIGCYSTR
jgi:hypothetical protein